MTRVYKHGEDTVQEILDLVEKGLSYRQVALIVLGRESANTTVSDIVNRERVKDYADSEIPEAKGEPKVLFIDLETSASIAATFPRFKANITPSAVIQEPYLLTAAWSANGVHGNSALHHLPSWEDDHTNDILMVEKLWELLDWADIVIAHNAGFDTGWMNTRFAYHGIEPPSPYKTICTLRALKRYFKLPANSLDASTKYFGLIRKLDHEGISMWVDCMNGCEQAMDRMLTYNKGDISTLEALYAKIRPFMQNHPNMALYYDDDDVRCNNCGSNKLEPIKDKFAYTGVSKFNVLRCKGCGAVKRTRINVLEKEKRDSLIMNIAG